MKFLFKIVFLVTLCSTIFSQNKILDKIVAVVDKEIILESELNAQISFYVMNGKLDANISNIEKIVLDKMIEEKLILAQAIVDSVEVSDSEVQMQLDEIISSNIKRIGSEKKLEEMYGMSIAKLKIEFREEIKKQILTQKMNQLKFMREKISKQEVEKFYNDYKDSLEVIPASCEFIRIFIEPKVGDDAKKNVKEKAEKILDSLKNNSISFEECAKKYSDDLGTAKNGGDLGFARRGQFVKEFEEVAFGLKEGEISAIVETQFGFHIVKLIEKRGDAVNVKHILFKLKRTDNDENVTMQLLISLRDSIQNDEKKFFECAKKYSIEKSLLTEKFFLDELNPNLKTAIDTTEIGKVSDVIFSKYNNSNGYEIIFLKNKTSQHKANLQDDYKQIEQVALNVKKQKVYKNWIEELKKNIYWEIKI